MVQQRGRAVLGGDLERGPRRGRVGYRQIVETHPPILARGRACRELDMQAFTCITWRGAAELDQVFKALADPTRRLLLDRLHERNGQTLGELCQRLGMARQSATQHLSVLEAANLVSTVRRGRAKLHYLNPVPLQEIQERWIDKFERPRLRALSALKTTSRGRHERPADIRVRHLHREHPGEGMARADRSRPDRRLLGAQQHLGLAGGFGAGSTGAPTAPGSPMSSDGGGEQPADATGHHLGAAGGGSPETTSRVTFEIESYDAIVRLTVTHEDLADESERKEASEGWAAVLSNLKSLLETGRTLPAFPWEMPSRS